MLTPSKQIVFLYKDTIQGSQVALMVKNLPANTEHIGDMGLSLGWEEPLEEGMESHSSILAWRTPGTEEPGGLQSMGLQKIRHNLVTEQQQRREKP